MAARVIEGRDGRLFLTDDTNDVMRQISGCMKAGRRQLARISSAHAVREELCAELGAAYRHVICPNKESVEADALPAAYAYERYGPTYLAQYLASGPKVRPFYDRGCLAELDGAYFRTDSHWTEFGAKAYLEAALAHWGDTRALDRLHALGAEPAEVELQGDLGAKIGLGPEKALGYYLPNEDSALLFESNLPFVGYVRWQRSSASANAGIRALVLHDSFTAYLYRFLCELYAETLFIYAPDLDARFLRRFRPDVFWFFQAERFLPREPRNNIDFVQLIKDNERRKKMPTQGSRFLHEGWPP